MECRIHSTNDGGKTETEPLNCVLQRDVGGSVRAEVSRLHGVDLFIVPPCEYTNSAYVDLLLDLGPKTHPSLWERIRSTFGSRG